MTDKKGLKTTKNDYPKYHCSKCDYTTCDISNWKRHLKTKKHNTDKRLTNTDTLGKKRLKRLKIGIVTVEGLINIDKVYFLTKRSVHI